ncbi:MAG TPA: hypothetical protein PK228_12385 [Saprospiraceae bacterium]|nr:hypothetical protein [Saprospiraceae bacterium]
MNKKTLLTILGVLLVVVVFVSRIILRSMRHRGHSSGNNPTERVEPTANIEGLDDHTIKKGESKTIRISLKGLSCNDLRVSASGISLSRKESSDCSFEVSGANPGNAFIRVHGAGRALIDSFPITVSE